MARLLRALQATGRGPSTLPDPIITRLAHVDAVTARYLIDGVLHDDDVRSAANSMRSVERWILERLPVADMAALRAQAISVKIEEAELTQPVLRTDWTGDDVEGSDRVSIVPSAEGRSMRFGLSKLADDELGHICRRLGIRVGPELLELDESVASIDSFDVARLSSEQAVLRTLLDGHLLAILIATLPGEAHRLLAAIVRGTLDQAALREFAGQEPWPRARVSDRAHGADLGIEVPTPAQILRGCALAFAGGPGGCLWVPIEIHRRIDGVLRAFGV